MGSVLSRTSHYDSTKSFAGRGPTRGSTCIATGKPAPERARSWPSESGTLRHDDLIVTP